MNRKMLLFPICLLVILTACSNGTQQQTSASNTNNQVPSPPIPNFNADTAYRFIEAQVAFGPRIPGSQAHKYCGDYLEKQFKRFGATVTVQTSNVTTHDGKTYVLRNIIGSYQSEKTERILITAHWDARPWSDQDTVKAPFDAANDGGSGVAVILELARQLQQQQASIGVDFILWDLEDYGQLDDRQANEPTWCLGSQYWAKHPHIKNYKARFGINLDMVGGNDPLFTKEQVSLQYATPILDKIWAIANELGYANYFRNTESGSIIDDHFWVNQYGIPCVDIIHFSDAQGFYPYWHTQQDNISHINKTVLGIVGQVVLTAISREH